MGCSTYYHGVPEFRSCSSFRDKCRILRILRRTIKTEELRKSLQMSVGRSLGRLRNGTSSEILDPHSTGG